MVARSESKDGPDKQKTVLLKKIVIDDGRLNIVTKFGERSFEPNVPIKISQDEAEALIELRTKQRKLRGDTRCDLVVVK